MVNMSAVCNAYFLQEVEQLERFEANVTIDGIIVRIHNGCRLLRSFIRYLVENRKECGDGQVIPAIHEGEPVLLISNKMELVDCAIDLRSKYNKRIMLRTTVFFSLQPDYTIKVKIRKLNKAISEKWRKYRFMETGRTVKCIPRKIVAV